MFKAAREYLTPVLHTSAFVERGVLTPEEFVRAGDHLVTTCPTWSWSSGEAVKIKSYLPSDKQFLVTRGVPSYRRAVDMNNDELRETVEAGGLGESDADWNVTDLVPIASADTVAAGLSAMAVSKPAAVPDVADFEDESLQLDSEVLQPSAAESGPTGLLKARRYDVSITYDKYYQTPRIWLFGYDESGSPLTPERIFDDVMSDYSNRTVTLDPHPHLSLPHGSVHPCQHGAAMKQVVEELMSGGGPPPSTDQYLFIFLKFMQSVIPTIEFDNTINVQLLRKKRPSDAAGSTA